MHSGTAANWGGIDPTGTDVARFNASLYTNAPTVNANLTVGELLFDAGNTAGVTFGAGSSTLTLDGAAGVGLQLNSGTGAVSTGSAKFAGTERITGPAGTFECEKFIWNTSFDKILHVWRTGPHHMFVRLLVAEGDKEGSVYDLVALETQKMVWPT
jgi:hypothetical protein